MLVIVLLVVVELVHSAVRTVSEPVSTHNSTSEVIDNNEISADKFECPTEVNVVSLLSWPCKADKDCRQFGLEQICCRVGGRKICRRKTLQPIPEQAHVPLVPGIPRRCPTKHGLMEVLPVKNCTRDDQCGPRICCPAGRIAYCRTAVHVWNETLPLPLVQTLNTMVSYIQCTPPPPPLLDLFPKPCRNSIDCFPNLCCQERGKKICRPPKRSISVPLLRLLASQLNQK